MVFILYRPLVGLCERLPGDPELATGRGRVAVFDKVGPERGQTERGGGVLPVQRVRHPVQVVPLQEQLHNRRAVGSVLIRQGADLVRVADPGEMVDPRRVNMVMFALYK